MEFSREPRLPAPSMVRGEVTIEPPPEVPKPVPGNPLARLLPVAMLVAAGGMMALYFTSGGGSTSRGPMFMFFPIMMVGSVLGSLVYSTRGANQNAQLNEGRRDYLDYLDTLDRTIAETAVDQHRSLHWSHPDPATLWTLVGGQRMWERARDDPDFCHVRVGLGGQSLSTTLVAPEPGPDPVTSSAVSRLMRRRSMVADVPVVVSLRGVSAVAFDGKPTTARALMRAVLCQLAVQHSPEDLRIAAVTASMCAEWDWLKWLPHHQHPLLADALGPARMTYRSLAEATAACGNAAAAPHAVVVVDDGLAPRLEQPFTEGPCLRLALDGDTRPDGLTASQASVCARRLAPYRSVAGSPPTSTADWLELMSLPDPENIEPARQWHAWQGRPRLRVPIGVSEGGEPVMLDIKEAAQNGMGPHGLCVGATGSGKSEFLRTLVLGMIAAHPPDVVNLVLVDFKGGATFLGLDRVHHVSAIITNLSDEAHLVARMQDALAGEMNRRQALLRAAGHFANVADYDRARRQGRSLPPIPALFIVVDEFSELLSQHPEFAELFVAIGRLGRSLGMHLLLASQRLDEGRLRGLETHLSYRICLKTFSASESRAVLGLPDAYHLPSAPGAAYLKTADSAVVRFQTAFVSAPHKGTVSVQGLGAPSTPRLFTAAVAGRITEPEQSPEGTGAQTLMDTVLTRFSGCGTPAHRVWLPPLTESPSLGVLIAGASTDRRLSVPIGVIDSPYDQRRDLLIADMSGAAGNVAIVGAPRAGKSTAVRTLVTAVAATHDPTAAQFYCLDFGGGELAGLRDFPHVGSVAGRADADLCRRMVAEMESIVRSREAGSPRTGDVFLVVDGWATLRQDFEALEPRIISLAAQGLSYGVHVVVTASRWAELRPALKDQLGTRIELQLGDPADSEMDRRRARQLGHTPPGRGITREGKEMVIARPQLDKERIMQASGRRARPIELLPPHVPHDASGDQVVIGAGERELQPVALDFVDQPHFLVLGETECGKTSTLRLLCLEIVRTKTADAVQIEIVDFRRTLLGVVESAHLGGYSMSATSLTARVSRLLGQLEARLPSETVTQRQLRDRSWWCGPQIYLVIDDYDLVATATGNPLTPLADYLPHAKDVGLHVIVARRSGGAARAMFDPFLARLRDMGCMGLMMSAGADEGVLLGSVRPSPQPPGRGTLVVRGQPDQLIQVAWTDPP
jgi:S-DNA-T family DNA segregation ATPase FtsK/SpoIIIE